MAKANAPEDEGDAGDARVPAAAVAVRLAEALLEAECGIVHVARNERRAGQTSRIVAALAPSVTVLPFPGWDCVPFDRAAPSRYIMARRIDTLRRLAAGPHGPFLVVTTPEALAQRVPPRSTWESAVFPLKVGDELQVDALEAFLLGSGYTIDDRVDEMGEAALRGAVIDLFPTGSDQPIRLDHSEGRITGMRRYDADSQRTFDEEVELTLAPVSEVVLTGRGEGEIVERFAGIEHFLPDFYKCTETLFDYAPGAVFSFEAGLEAGHQRFWTQIEDAYETRRSVPRGETGLAPLPPARLYIDPAEWRKRLKKVRPASLDVSGIGRLPRFARAARPADAFVQFIAKQRDRGARIVLASAQSADLAALVRRARRVVDTPARQAADWAGVLSASAGDLLTLAVDLEEGFFDDRAGLAVIGAADLLGRRASQVESAAARAGLGVGELELRPGDTIVHIDHGLAVLRGIETVAPTGGAASDVVVLEFADAAKLLVPAEDMGRLWRYGGAADAVSLDKMGGTAWPKRREGLEQDLARLAARLVGLARDRQEARAEALVPPSRRYDAFVAGFPFAETADQAQAIDDVLEDLRSGRPMDRLVCGDVGFGKTEVALRAAAAAVLAGKQVAIAAPTTVLVRQHVQTFSRRFASIGVKVAHLSRLVKPAEARAVKAGLASGDLPVVIGTHSLAAKGVSFQGLGLLIIDEEQRFGGAQKERLRGLGKNVHVLTLTATPIPRTLQIAMIGLQELSVVATPPARRQPVRTLLTAFDPVTVRAALMRERARGGQSFVVCPRIEDIEPMAERLAGLVPELLVVKVHGKMPVEEMDAAMVDFADGVGDVLLATNIIESGLDVPRANTILIWRPDRFGLAQLHQLRGRVGRGRARGAAYLLTDAAAKLTKATETRLRTLEAQDRLGAGFAISGRDLDLRGAGDILGDEQAGHVKLIGLALYQHLLQKALAVARGEAAEEDWTPAVRLGLDAHVPVDYIPEPEIRIDLHARIARLADDDEPGALADEINDRFGPPPEAVANLIVLAELRRSARRLGIEKLDAGPEAIAATFRDGAAVGAAARAGQADGLEWRDTKLVWAQPSASAADRRRLAQRFLALIAGGKEVSAARQRELADDVADAR